MFTKRRNDLVPMAPITRPYREACRVWAVATDLPLVMEDLEPYGCKLLFCLPLDVGDEYTHYINIMAAPNRITFSSDSVFLLLGDFFRLRGDGYGHVLSVTCIHEYWWSEVRDD